MKVFIALSAFGNILAQVYTASRVKQQIARQCILPFFKFFSQEDKQFETPVGGLILHWIFTVVWIIVTPNTSGGYGFVIGIFIYGQLFVALCVGFAFFFIRRTYEGRESRKTPENASMKNWNPVIFTKADWLGYFPAIVFIGINMMILVQSARSREKPDRWIWPIIIFSILGVASCYWAAIRIIAKVSKSKETIPIEIRIVRSTRGGGHTGKAEDTEALKKAKKHQNNRIVVYELHGKAKEFAFWVDIWSHKLYKLIAR